MVKLKINPSSSTSVSLTTNDIIVINKSETVTRLTEISNGGIMVFCGKDMVGFYNGDVNYLIRSLGWSK